MAVSLQWPDYLVLVTFLVISLGIGVYHSLTGGKQRTTTEFIMANRSLGVIPAGISMLVSYQSAIAILGTTTEMYQYGIQYLIMVNIAWPIAMIVAATIYVPWLYSMKLTSVYRDGRKSLFV